MNDYCSKITKCVSTHYIGYELKLAANVNDDVPFKEANSVELEESAGDDLIVNGQVNS